MATLHLKEDLSKPENRTNLALFGILNVPEVKEYIWKYLDLPIGIILPSSNLKDEEFTTTERPDFKVVPDLHSKEVLAYIEVELGPEDREQVRRYGTRKIPIRSVVGKETYVSKCKARAISLESIGEVARRVQPSYEGSQLSASIELFLQLVQYYVTDGHFSDSGKRAPISQAMKGSFIVKGLMERLGEGAITFEGKAQPGRFAVDTVKENGFSLRVYSRVSSARSVSLMTRTAGRREITFPSARNLEKYLPNRKDEILAYLNLIKRLGARDNDALNETERAKLPLSIVEENLDVFAKALRGLC